MQEKDQNRVRGMKLMMERQTRAAAAAACAASEEAAKKAAEAELMPPPANSAAVAEIPARRDQACLSSAQAPLYAHSVMLCAIIKGSS